MPYDVPAMLAAARLPSAPAVLMGIVNITRDSFSDGGLYFKPADAIAHGRRLRREHADILDLGPSSSHPDAETVTPAQEIERLRPVMETLIADGATISVDSYHTETQRFALGAGAAYLNDIQGFADAAFYPELASSSCRLVIMHSIQGQGPATRRDAGEDGVLDRIFEFFDARLEALTRAGVAQERMILDPGMGFFLGTRVAPSLEVLHGLPGLKARFGLPILVSVSRKSFLRRLVGPEPERLAEATLAAELFATAQGASYIRTHEPAPLRSSGSNNL